MDRTFSQCFEQLFFVEAHGLLYRLDVYIDVLLALIDTGMICFKVSMLCAPDIRRYTA